MLLCAPGVHRKVQTYLEDHWWYGDAKKEPPEEHAVTTEPKDSAVCGTDCNYTFSEDDDIIMCHEDYPQFLPPSRLEGWFLDSAC